MKKVFKRTEKIPVTRKDKFKRRFLHVKGGRREANSGESYIERKKETEIQQYQKKGVFQYRKTESRIPDVEYIRT